MSDLTTNALDLTGPSVAPDARPLGLSLLQALSDKIAGRPAAINASMLTADIPQTPAELAAAAPAQPSPQPVAASPVAPDVTTKKPVQPAAPSAHAIAGAENGRLAAAMLKKVGQGSHRLYSPAADSFVAMRTAAAADGVALKLTDSYRSFDEQVAVRAKKGHLVATATPGTSVHGWGKAIDIDVSDARTLAWLRANGGRYGWQNPAWAQPAGKSHEPWHWEWDGGQQ